MAEHLFDPLDADDPVLADDPVPADDPAHPVGPAHLPAEMPSDVRQPLMWWMGVRLLTDHQPRRLVAPWQAGPVCRACGRPWPCPPHRLGARGLLAARQSPPEGP